MRYDIVIILTPFVLLKTAVETEI